VRGAVKVPEGFQIGSEGVGTLLPLPSERRTTDLLRRSCTKRPATTRILGIRKGDATRQQEGRGKVKKLQWRVKEAVGIITGDSALERERSRQRVGGAAQQSLGKARRKVGESVDGVAKAIKK
jgi:uncharacterized protein YjbJ (UPF0337 family)